MHETYQSHNDDVTDKPMSSAALIRFALGKSVYLLKRGSKVKSSFVMHSFSNR